jgi:hypothetical protein
MNEGAVLHITEYEKRQIDAINVWLARPPSLAVRTIKGAGAVIDWAARKVLPDGTVDQAIEHLRSAGSVMRGVIPVGAIEGALHANMWLADRWVYEHKVLRDLGAANFQELRYYDLERLDRASGNVHDWAIAYAGAAGGAAGAGGIVFAVPGIAAVINISLRTIRKIGLCYGYADVDDIERRFIYNVLALGGADQAEKLASLTAIREIQVMVTRQTFKSMAEKAMQDKMSKEALVTTIRSVAQRLGYQMTRKRILMSVPLVGGGIGLFLDGNYLRNIGWAATRSYQHRWFLDNGKWPGPRAEGGKGTAL